MVGNINRRSNMVVSKEFEFYIKADLSKYEGKYVAIVGDKVVAFGSNASHVLDEAKKKAPNKKPMLAKVPKEETLILVLKWK